MRFELGFDVDMGFSSQAMWDRYSDTIYPIFFLKKCYWAVTKAMQAPPNRTEYNIYTRKAPITKHKGLYKPKY